MDKLIRLSKKLMSDSELLHAKELKAGKLAKKLEKRTKKEQLCIIQ